MLRSYLDDQQGSFSILFVMSLFVAYLSIAVVVDVSKIHQSREKLQFISDAAALYTLKHDSKSEEKAAIFKTYVNKLADSMGEDTYITTTKINVHETDERITLTASTTAPFELTMTKFMSSFNKVAINTNAEIGIEDVEVALVIDISSSMKNARINEAKASAKLFVKQLLDDDSIVGRISISLVPFGGTVRVPVEMKDLLQTPTIGLELYSQNWIDGEWNQCFEFDIDDIKNGVKYDKTYRVLPDFYSWNQTNPWCPLEGNEFMPLTNDAQALTAKIDNFTLSDGTGSDHGMHWGYESLNNYWENKFPGGLVNTPAANYSGVKKVIIFMSDGGITAQHYVRPQHMVGNVPFNSRKKQRISYTNALVAFEHLCDKAKSEDIEVYTIAYLITKSAHREPLQNCASSESHYVDARSGDLENIFSRIAASISPLRISM
ncbi:pilus assembly protein TadG-related protein [Hellea balneolensis]|uniref:pilus assembly protein TadG-related protein n=1 Tax=Hellea balneolensis TaxID=287478 RepID=UPI00047911B8|nr:pilus assembly protein TadG-related protein [Hellea balneolensis]